MERRGCGRAWRRLGHNRHLAHRLVICVDATINKKRTRTNQQSTTEEVQRTPTRPAWPSAPSGSRLRGRTRAVCVMHGCEAGRQALGAWRTPITPQLEVSHHLDNNQRSKKRERFTRRGCTPHKGLARPWSPSSSSPPLLLSLRSLSACCCPVLGNRKVVDIYFSTNGKIRRIKVQDVNQRNGD